MKIIIADKYAALLDLVSLKDGGAKDSLRLVIAKSKNKTVTEVMVEGKDEATFPAKVEYLQGEAKLEIGDILLISATSGLVVDRKMPTPPVKKPVTKSGSPDRSFKEQCM